VRKKLEAVLTSTRHPHRLFQLVDMKKGRHKPRSRALVFSSPGTFIMPQMQLCTMTNYAKSCPW